MSIYSIYFSPTGGTKKVMDILAGEWKDGKTRSLDLSGASVSDEKYSFKKEDICLIGVPAFGGRVPDVAAQRLRSMSGGGAGAVLVVVYGNRAYDDTFAELADLAVECGFEVKAGIAAVAEHSIMRQYAKGRPDAQDVRELKEFAREIQRNWETQKKAELPGNRPYRSYDGVPFKPKADKRCNGCGGCARECPVQAIPKENPSKTDKEKCISCMRCIAVCPRHARKLNPVMLYVASHKMKKLFEGRKPNELFQ